MQETAIYGGIFAILVLLVFIRRIPMTLMIAIAMPLSMLITLVVMFFTNFTLNMLTLMGLMLSVGMVVDNAIVVVENIQRRRDEGESARRAAVMGASEVGLALIVATSTTVVVFLPMILMSGNESLSFYLGKIGFPVCISLIASLIVSLLFIPLTSMWVLSRGGRATQTSRLIQSLEHAYHKGLSWVVDRRLDAALLFIAVFATILIPMEHVKQTDEQSAHLNDINVHVSFPRTMNIDERNAYFRKVEEAIIPYIDELGLEAVRVRITRQGGNRINAYLMDRVGRDDLPDRKEVSRRLEALLPDAAGVTARVRGSQARRNAAAGDASLTLQLRGPDSNRLAELSNEVTRRLALLDEVKDIETELAEDSTDELHFLVEREYAQMRGLSSALIGGAIDYALRGRRLSRFHMPNKQVPMRIEGDPAAARDLERLRTIEVPNPEGGKTQVRLVTDTESTLGFGTITRENRQTVLDIKVSTETDDLEAFSKRVDSVMAGVELPRGYTLDKGQRIQSIQQNADARLFALVMAVICVFLLMGVLFESATMPLAIIFSIPFALLGVYWALYITSTSLDVMAGVGLIILVGIVVNNGIVLIDTVNQRRLDGATLRDAVLEGATRRLRPVLMTALTTIFGLIPMAIGDAGIIGIPYSPLARSVIGGLVASTLLTLFVVPYLYLLLAEANAARQRMMQRLKAG